MTLNILFFLFFLQIYNDKKNQFQLKKITPNVLVDRVADDIAKLLKSKSKVVEVRLSQLNSSLL